MRTQIISLLFVSAVASAATCVPKNLSTPAPKDPVVRVLAQQSTCPKTAVEFVDAVKRTGARMEPTMVNFMGFHNPDPGAFFIFEIVSSNTIPRGDLLFGHFLTNEGGKLVSAQQRLRVELIAWDTDKQFYNFYELFDGAWSYRGDSKDILDDIQLLHRQRTAQAKPFGPRLRCSGCHVNGGLLQKELTVPHNDWFVSTRKLPLGSLKADAFVAAKMADLVDADELTKLVAGSARRLADSPGYQKVLAARGMQERLRPLFCPVELNIESDADPVDDKKPALRVPAGFFADPRLAATDISIQREHYDAAVRKQGFRLPDTPGRADADHGWLTPVKAQSDITAVDALIERGVVDKEFAADVLAIDFTNPVFSTTRCGLLKLVPDKAGADFAERFQSALRGASVAGATELLGNFTDPARNAAFHQKQALAYLTKCQERSTEPAAVLDWSRLLAQRRAEVSASEISQNPKGHILEDTERVVFPTTQSAVAPGKLGLSPSCQVQ